jgi:hypothetical protein
MRLRLTLTTTKAEAALRRVQQNVSGVMSRTASQVMGKHLLPEVSTRTPKPGEPLPEGAVYIRTGRLNRGWAPAARLFNAKKVKFPTRGFVPPEEGQGILQSTPDGASAIAVNLTPYALAVEILGPGAIFGRGIVPTFKGGVRMVTKAQESLAGGAEVRKEFNKEWKQVHVDGTRSR